MTFVTLKIGTLAYLYQIGTRLAHRELNLVRIWRSYLSMLCNHASNLWKNNKQWKSAGHLKSGKRQNLESAKIWKAPKSGKRHNPDGRQFRFQTTFSILKRKKMISVWISTPISDTSSSRFQTVNFRHCLKSRRTVNHTQTICPESGLVWILDTQCNTNPCFCLCFNFNLWFQSFSAFVLTIAFALSIAFAHTIAFARASTSLYFYFCFNLDSDLFAIKFLQSKHD